MNLSGKKKAAAVNRSGTRSGSKRRRKSESGCARRSTDSWSCHRGEDGEKEINWRLDQMSTPSSDTDFCLRSFTVLLPSLWFCCGLMRGDFADWGPGQRCVLRAGDSRASPHCAELLRSAPPCLTLCLSEENAKWLLPKGATESPRTKHGLLPPEGGGGGE